MKENFICKRNLFRKEFVTRQESTALPQLRSPFCFPQALFLIWLRFYAYYAECIVISEAVKSQTIIIKYTNVLFKERQKQLLDKFEGGTTVRCPPTLTQISGRQVIFRTSILGFQQEFWVCNRYSECSTGNLNFNEVF